MHQQQHHPAGARQSAASSQAGFPGFLGAPGADLLPAPALALLTNALAVPGMILGSILETNVLPSDLGSSGAGSTGGPMVAEPANSSALATGEQACLVANW